MRDTRNPIQVLFHFIFVRKSANAGAISTTTAMPSSIFD
jgi:hypothetical protein